MFIHIQRQALVTLIQHQAPITIQRHHILIQHPALDTLIRLLVAEVIPIRHQVAITIPHHLGVILIQLHRIAIQPHRMARLHTEHHLTERPSMEPLAMARQAMARLNILTLHQCRV